MLSWISPPRLDDAVVVDVGCGNGAYLVELGRRGHRGTTVGVDLSEGMLKTSRRAMPRAHAIIADASTLPLKDHTAALVLAMHVLYHVPDPVIAITEFRCGYSLHRAAWSSG